MLHYHKKTILLHLGIVLPIVLLGEIATIKHRSGIKSVECNSNAFKVFKEEQKDRKSRRVGKECQY